jgi:hypothetical protein
MAEFVGSLESTRLKNSTTRPLATLKTKLAMTYSLLFRCGFSLRTTPLGGRRLDFFHNLVNALKHRECVVVAIVVGMDNYRRDLVVGNKFILDVEHSLVLIIDELAVGVDQFTELVEYIQLRYKNLVRHVVCSF